MLCTILVKYQRKEKWKIIKGIQHALENKSVSFMYAWKSHSKLTTIINRLKFNGLTIQALVFSCISQIRVHGPMAPLDFSFPSANSGNKDPSLLGFF